MSRGIGAYRDAATGSVHNARKTEERVTHE
jgi:hypothetical protein